MKALLLLLVLTQDIPNPWANEKSGSWYRWKSTSSGMEIYIDTGLKEQGAGFYLTVSQTYMMGKYSDESPNRVELKGEPVKPVGSEEVEVGGSKVPCDIYEISGAKTWVVKEGDFKGAGVKMESAAMKMTATKLAKDTVKVKDRAFECIVVEAETDMAGQKSKTKTWSSASFPLSTVRSESAATAMELVDFGDDWSKRPEPKVVRAPPPENPKPAEDKAAKSKMLIDEADALLKEATPIFKEVKAGAVAPPADASARKELAKKADDCERKLYNAQLKYIVAQPDAPDPELIKKRVKQLDKLLANVKEYKGKLK